MSEECPRCGAVGGFGCYECAPEIKGADSDDLVKQTLHSLEGLDAYVRALDEYNDALVAANEELEAKLAKAVEALEKIATLGKCEFAEVRATLEELKHQE